MRGRTRVFTKPLFDRLRAGPLALPMDNASVACLGEEVVADWQQVFGDS